MKDARFGKKEGILQSKLHKATIKEECIICVLTTYVFMVNQNDVLTVRSAREPQWR